MIGVCDRRRDTSHGAFQSAHRTRAHHSTGTSQSGDWFVMRRSFVHRRLGHVDFFGAGFVRLLESALKPAESARERRHGRGCQEQARFLCHVREAIQDATLRVDLFVAFRLAPSKKKILIDFYLLKFRN